MFPWKDHPLHSSSARVLALVLEEIAIDRSGTPDEAALLEKAESLHLSCLSSSKTLFGGEHNTQTAKHYGNLGRLYQTMKKFEVNKRMRMIYVYHVYLFIYLFVEDAEAMHLRSISIKESLLGGWDYEVALSLGHLASLYNYDLLNFNKAEALHLRSIQIGQFYSLTPSSFFYYNFGCIVVVVQVRSCLGWVIRGWSMSIVG